MLLLIILALFAIIMIVLATKTKIVSDVINILLVLSVITFAIVALIHIVMYVSSMSFPVEYNAAKTTIRSHQTLCAEDFEGEVLLIHTEINRKIAMFKYWRTSIWVGIAVPKKTTDLPYLTPRGIITGDKTSYVHIK